jgi:hypothetical protein
MSPLIPPPSRDRILYMFLSEVDGDCKDIEVNRRMDRRKGERWQFLNMNSVLNF